MPFLNRRGAGAVMGLIFAALALTGHPNSRPATRFEISFPASLHAQPITGRVFVYIARDAGREPRQGAPIFGVDVDQLQPDRPAVIDGSTLGFPPRDLSQIPAGDYYVQALLNVYTEFHRSDGHIIWAHNDQWEGQRLQRSPGNLLSRVQKLHLDPAQGYSVQLELSQVIPPIKMPEDTGFVKHVKIHSEKLTKFWGQPIYLGATVGLPKGYDQHPNVRYPVLYKQGHFGVVSGEGAITAAAQESDADRKARAENGLESRSEFEQALNSENFPRLITVTFQHPTPYFDDSYAVNSANNGPYGDALLEELVPYLESHFRIIPKPYARVLSGGSTGGWESLALQVYHPQFFNGTWSMYPDPVDFHHYQLVNIYDDSNAFQAPGYASNIPERPAMRTSEGQVQMTVRQMSQMEEVLGSRGRSAKQFEAWEAVYGPVGPDGYPQPLWDKLTGKIDHTVANYMRDHGYDLTEYLRQNWPRIGKDLVGKIHVYCGDMDSYYLNLAVYDLEDFLKTTKDPFYAGSFSYGRPKKTHGWQGVTRVEMIRQMAAHIAQTAPSGENTAAWTY